MREWPAAVISSDGLYRYVLSRRWGLEGRRVAFIGLNPSTADATLDDPTIRRCVGFAKAWGGTSLLMVNLFGFRSTAPAALRQVVDPIGPENDLWLDRVVAGADLVVAAWGNHGVLLNRAEFIRQRFSGKLQALAITKSGMPKHPLYIAASASPMSFV